MPLISLKQAIRFDSNDGESVLDAARRANVHLAYSCRTGRCSSCKCKVVSGESVALVDELGLSQQEREDGWILGCARTATSDMQLDVEPIGNMPVPQAKMVPCRINALEKLTNDAIKVTLRLPPTSDFAFLPGQYVDVIGPGGVRRSYSLANAQSADKLLELHIRAVPDGVMSRYWFNDARPNDLLRLNGPLGTFFLRDVTDQDLVFLATGTGIAPVKAMLEGIARTPPDARPRSIAVYWGNRRAGDLYWDVMSVPGPYRYTPVLSKANDEWRGVRGHVQDALMASSPDLSRSVVYACGSDAMIRSAKTLLTLAGLPDRCFLSDAFVCSAGVTSPQ